MAGAGGGVGAIGAAGARAGGAGGICGGADVTGAGIGGGVCRVVGGRSDDVAGAAGAASTVWVGTVHPHTPSGTAAATTIAATLLRIDPPGGPCPYRCPGEGRAWRRDLRPVPRTRDGAATRVRRDSGVGPSR
ncbi:hypothetical protein GCM10023094_15410 [Rhodococcus olei]|uniref:Uncharacterized protein n=1 Tax=Rhodococcus olei TaxID=2161675 RepID=A0ABP8NZP1_9NOCA